MNVQRITIPLDHGRKHIDLIFKQNDPEGDWSCTASNECMKDIVALIKKHFGVVDINTTLRNRSTYFGNDV